MQLLDENGNVKWDSNNLSEADANTTFIITEILKELLTNITLRMSTTLDDEALSLTYTKEQIDEKLSGFLSASNLGDSITSIVNELVPSKVTESMSDYDVSTLRGYVLDIYKLMYGYDFNGVKDPNITAYSVTLDELKKTISSHGTDINTLVGFVLTQDGTQVRQRNVPYLRETGRIEDLTLNKGRTDTNMLNMVSAINEVQKSIPNVDKIGDLTTLETTEKSTLVHAINELFISCSNFKQRVASAITAKGVSTDANSTTDTFVENITAIPVGVDTTDANALAEEILAGKTAYVNGEKITGTLQVRENLSTRFVSNEPIQVAGIDTWTSLVDLTLVENTKGIFNLSSVDIIETEIVTRETSTMATGEYDENWKTGLNIEYQMSVDGAEYQHLSVFTDTATLVNSSIQIRAKCDHVLSTNNKVLAFQSLCNMVVLS